MIYRRNGQEFREIVRLFVIDLNATKITQVTGLKGVRGREAREKTIVFGLFKRNGAVYTEVVAGCSKAALQGIIAGRVDLESVIYSEGWRGYDGLVGLWYQKHFRVHHSEN